MGGTDTDTNTDMMAREDTHTAELFGCRSCGRLVCDVCAVVEGRGDGGREVGMGMGCGGGGRTREIGTGSSERECLGCRISRGKKGGVKWIGGIGWMP